MRKILLALAIGCASLVTLNSCTKEYVTNYLPGVSYVYPIKSDQWSLDGDTYIFEQAIPALDNAYFEDGHVSLAISYDNNETVYEIVPAVIENYSFSANYSIGKVKIFAEEIGNTPTIQPPANMIIKIVLTDAEIGN